MASLRLVRQWTRNDLARLQTASNSLGRLLDRSQVLANQGNPMLSYLEVQSLASAQAIILQKIGSLVTVPA